MRNIDKRLQCIQYFPVFHLNFVVPKTKWNKKKPNFCCKLFFISFIKQIVYCLNNIFKDLKKRIYIYIYIYVFSYSVFFFTIVKGANPHDSLCQARKAYFVQVYSCPPPLSINYIVTLVKGNVSSCAMFYPAI